VALVITDLDVGGAERAMAGLATTLEPKRWQPRVFCLAGPGRLAAVLEQANVRCEFMRANHRTRAGAFIRLARGLRRFEPQLIQSFMFHANLAARLGGLLARCPWVVSGLRVAERRKRWHLILDQLTAPLATGSVCVSAGVMRFSRDIAGLDPTRLTIIRNGIDPAPFDSAARLVRSDIHVPVDAHLVLYIGRLDPQKGLPDLLAAASSVIAQQRNWHLALAGDGPSRPWLLREIDRHSLLRDRVHPLGRRDDVSSLLKLADVLVHPSLWEGMPNVVLEAMAARRPVIGTAVEGTEDLVIPGQTGWLIPPGDLMALTQALIEAARSADRCRRYGEEGRRRIERDFSLKATVSAYERLWAGILGFEPLDVGAGPAAD
jgi:starch synthase (maltosyl-transferring)